MANGDAPQRISVSQETLRNEIKDAIQPAILELKLDLIKELASKEDVQKLDKDFTDIRTSVRDHEKWILGFRPLSEALQREHATLVSDVKTLKETIKKFDNVIADVEDLKTSKAEDTAVANFKKYLLTGGVLSVLIMLIQVSISIYLVTHGVAHRP